MGYMYEGGPLLLIRIENIARHTCSSQPFWMQCIIQNCTQSLPEILSVQLVLDSAVCTDGNRTVFGYSVEAKGIGALYSIGKRPVSIGISNLHGKGYASV